MSTNRPRGNIAPRTMQRQSVGSHSEIEESKSAQKDDPHKNEQKTRQMQIHVYKKRTEQARSKSEMGFFPSPNGQQGFSALKRCLERDTFWDKLVNRRLGKYFAIQINSKGLVRPPKIPLIRHSFQGIPNTEIVNF